MKNKLKKLNSFGFGCILCSLILSSCDKDILNQLPKDTLTEEFIWTNPPGAIQFVNGIYTQDLIVITMVGVKVSIF